MSGSLNDVQPFLLVALCQGASIEFENPPNPGPLRSRNCLSATCPGHTQIFVLGLNAVGLNYSLPLLTQEAGVPRKIIGFESRFLPTFLHRVGTGDFDGNAVVPKESHGPGMQVDNVNPVHAPRAEG